MVKKNKLKVLIIDNSPGVTGAFKSIFQISDALQSKYQFTYLLPKGTSVIPLLKKAGFSVSSFRFLELSKNLKSILFYLPALIFNSLKISRIVKKEKISIVHVNDIYNMTGIMVKRLNPQIKLIYHIRLLPTSYAGLLYPLWRKQVLKNADRIICVSQAVGQHFVHNKTMVIYDAIKVNNIKLVKPQNDTFTILYLANYIPGKGHRQALSAFAKALPNIKPAKMIFYGSTLNKRANQKFKQQLMASTDKLGLETHVSFNDFLENPAEKIVEADLMLNFSESESFSMTTLEAHTYGTAVIATRCGGPAEIIEDGISGILVPVNDIEAMSKAIIRIAQDDTLRSALTENGLSRAAKLFAIEKQAIKLDSLYSGLLSASN